ncbi:putative RfaB [Vibrio chagasii]|nr:putative RfaB [Vibrio chagasii]CAH6940104.1 putative RfaB [Vibrio chagasii]
MVKRVLIVSDEYYPKLGGAGVVAKTYKELLSNNGYDVEIITGSGKDHHRSFNKIRLFWPIQYFIMFFQVDLKKYDIVILNDGPAQYAASIYFDDVTYSKTITMIHGLERNFIDGGLINKLFGFKKQIHLNYLKSKRVVAVSDYIKSVVESELSNRRSFEIDVLHSPVTLKKEEGTKRKCKSLLTVGRVTEKKGHAMVYRIFKKLLEVDDDWTWTIVGDGDYLSELVGAVQNDRLENKVKFLGSIPTSELARVYSSHQVFILLSEFKEAYGLVYVEAAECGCITIGYNNCGPKETIRYSKNIHLADSGLSIEDYADFIVRKSSLNTNEKQNLNKVMSKKVLDYVDKFKR